MRILVTGAAGFIGSHLCEHLCALGHSVVGLDAFTDYYDTTLKESNAALLNRDGVDVMRLNLASDDLDLPRADIVYHLAAQPGISQTASLVDYVENNVFATARLLDALSERPPEMLIYASTSSVYGAYANCTEATPPAPISHYGVTKLAGEQLALAHARGGRISACSIRLFSVYGPRERPDKLFSKLIASILDERPFPLHQGSAQHKRSYTYVADAVNGLAAAIDHLERASGEVINIGTSDQTTTEHGIMMVEKIMGRRVHVDHLPPRVGDQIETRANIRKARRMFGYQPQVRAEEGLRRHVAWMTSNHRSPES